MQAATRLASMAVIAPSPADEMGRFGADGRRLGGRGGDSSLRGTIKDLSDAGLLKSKKSKVRYGREVGGTGSRGVAT